MSPAPQSLSTIPCSESMSHADGKKCATLVNVGLVTLEREPGPAECGEQLGRDDRGGDDRLFGAEDHRYQKAEARGERESDTMVTSRARALLKYPTLNANCPRSIEQHLLQEGDDEHRQHLAADDLVRADAGDAQAAQQTTPALPTPWRSLC